MRWLKLGILWTFFVACGLPYVAGFALVAGLFWLQAPLTGIIVPLMDASTVRQVGPEGYNRIRLWGSFGFGLVLAGFGTAVTSLSYETVGNLAVPTYLVLAALAGVLVLTLPRDAEQNPEAAPRGLLSLLGRPGLVAFLVFNLLHWAALSPFHIFLGLHVRELGIDPSVPGMAMAFGVVCEIGAFMAARTLFKRMDPAYWLVVVALLTSLRWWGTGHSTDASELIAWQALHGVTFGLWYAAVIQILGAFGALSERAGLQGLFAAVVFGLGGVIGQPAAGQLMEHFDGRTAFEGAALLELVALAWLLLTWRRWRPTPNGQPPTPNVQR
jgi:PPP family 3-phenylpropionic acid transporter